MATGGRFTLLEDHHYGFLHEQLSLYAHKWETIATRLGFKPDEIKNTKTNQMNVTGGNEACLGAVLADWMQWCPGDARGSKERATLEALKTAISKAGLGVVAEELTVTKEQLADADAEKSNNLATKTSVATNDMEEYKGSVTGDAETSHTEPTLVDSKDYGALLDQLQQCAEQWESIATGLQFTADEIESIKTGPSKIAEAPLSYLKDVIIEWLYWAPGDVRGSKDRPTLEALKVAVNQAGFGDIAAKLHLESSQEHTTDRQSGQSKPAELNNYPYLKVQHLTDEERNELITRLERQSKRIRSKFAALVTKTVSAIEQSKTESVTIKLYLNEYGRKDLGDLIETQDTIIEVITKLSGSKSWTFFDYELLEDLIESFCCDNKSIVESLESYKSHFKEYCKHRLDEIPLNSLNMKSAIHPESTICMKIDNTFFGKNGDTQDEMTLSNVKELQQKISELLGEKHLILVHFQKGCIELTFQHFKETNPLLLLKTPDLITQALIGVKKIQCGTISHDLHQYISQPPKVEGQAKSPKILSKDLAAQSVHEKLQTCKNKMEHLNKWISECKDSIEDLSLSDWRREKLTEGIMLYEGLLQQCQQNLTGTVLQQQQIGLESSTRLYKVDEVRKFLWSEFTATKFDHITATPLHRAVESHDMEKVREVLGGTEYSVNCTDSIGWTPLHYACAVGNLDMVRMLIAEFKADVSIQDVDGRTVVMLATLAGHENVVHALLSKYQCPVDTRDKRGNTVITYACVCGNTNLVRILIRDHNANVANNVKNTPLHDAASRGKTEVALALINEFGCDPSIKASKGWSLLHSACEGGSVSLVRTLIQKHNADIYAKNDDNNTPLHIAAANDMTEVALALINEFGVDPSIKGCNGWSLLHYACQGSSVNLVRTLIEKHNADISAKTDSNDTPLHIAASNGKEDIVLALINEFGCDPSIKGFKGWSLLHSACLGGSISLVQTLIEKHGADIYAKSNDNNTPLHIAAANGKEEDALTLISEYGCYSNIQGFEGWSLLHCACKRGSISLVRTLIQKYSADMYARDDKNNIPLHLAASYGKEEAALALINEFSCNPSIKGYIDSSLLHYACEGGSTSLVRTLIQKHAADIEARNYKNDTPLHIAASKGNEEVVLALINEFGCDPNIKGYNGCSLLHFACQGDNVSLVRILIQKYGLDIYAKTLNNSIPLHVAAYNGKEEVVFALINEFSCMIHLKGDDGNTLLHSACLSGNVGFVRTLIKELPLEFNIVNYDNNTPLHLAALNGDKDMVLALINEFNCDTSIKGENGWSLLQCARQGGNAILVQTLTAGSIHEPKFL